MRFCLLFVLILSFFSIAVSCDINPLPAFPDSPEKQTLAKVRDSLLTSLQTQDSNGVFRYVDVLKNSGYDERALDNYELIQIYFLMNQYDSTLVTLVREHYRFINDNYVDNESGCCSDVAPYSAFDDKLVDYLNKKIDLTKNANFQKLLERISDGTAKLEYRDFANLMKNILKNTSLRDKHKYCDASQDWNCQENRDAVQRVRFLGYYTTDDVKDTLFFDSLIKKLIAFQNKYPESEFNPWVMKQVELKKRSREFDFKRRHYYRERYYTGGIGGEAFIALNSEFGTGSELNIVLQYKRLMVTFSYSVLLGCNINCADKMSEFEGWLFLLGWDAFETKFFKIAPFVGFYDPFVAGLQLEFRPWISRDTDPMFSVGSYFSIKAKYELRYAKRFEKNVFHHFFIGCGFHFW